MRKDQRKLGCPSLSHQLHLHLEGKGETKNQIIKKGHFSHPSIAKRHFRRLMGFSKISFCHNVVL